jgi:DNA-binding NtrC family response regulator
VVLVIDDELGVRESLRVILKDDFEVLDAPDGATGLAIIRSRRVDVALLDVRMPGEPGPAVLPRILALSESIAVILITAVPHVRTAVEAIKGGAYDYIIKPFDVDEILALVKQAAQRRVLEREVLYLARSWTGPRLRRAGGPAPVDGALYELIAQVPRQGHVMITGESGTGKELVARAIHRLGPRADRPFVAINCGAIPINLLESELFGHEKGAFTGAHARKPGKFELAHGGTLFLDEVGSLRVDLQAKLLRALQQREIERLGGTRTFPVDVRVIAASNIDLKEATRTRAFREDLFYRLNVVPLGVPPLRARKDDIPLLVDHFVRKYSREFKRDVRGVCAARFRAGRVRLAGQCARAENIIERSVALTTHTVIQMEDLPLELALHEVGVGRGAREPSALSLKEARDRFEQAYVLRALEHEDWNQSRAARRLGVHRNTLIARLAAWGIRARDRSPAGRQAAVGERGTAGAPAFEGEELL